MKDKGISINDKIMGGMPCVEGTRIPVNVVLSNLAFYLDLEAVIEDYPSLDLEAIRNCLNYAANYIAKEYDGHIKEDICEASETNVLNKTAIFCVGDRVRKNNVDVYGEVKSCVLGTVKSVDDKYIQIYWDVNYFYNEYYIGEAEKYFSVIWRN